MELYVAYGRQNGKTFKSLKFSANTNTPILVANEKKKGYLKGLAVEYGLKIPEPITKIQII